MSRFPTSGRVAFVARRLGTRDGIAAASAVWQQAFSLLGWQVTTIAGSGSADHLVHGLDPQSSETESDRERAPVECAARAILDQHDLVVVENVTSLPSLVPLLAGRPALMRHHDLPWQHGAGTAGAYGRVPDDAAWRHVTINERSRLELAALGIGSATIYNVFDPEPSAGRREATRASLGMADGSLLLLQPTRAASTKNLAGGLLLAKALGATYWLLGPVDLEWATLLEQLARRTAVPVITGQADDVSLEDAYAASDVVVLPSTWEGFGNAAIEAALHERPFVVGPYPVGAELRRYGFSWFELHDPAPIARHLRRPDQFVVERNGQVARVRFSADHLAERLPELLTER